MGRIQKGIVAIELVLLLAGGGVIAFTSDVDLPPPPPSATAFAKPLSTARVSVPSDDERRIFRDELRVDINKADAQLIAMIEGVGRKTAENIVAYRDANGPYTSYKDLDNIPGIGKRTIEAIAAGIKTLGGESFLDDDSLKGLVDINMAGENELQKITGIGPSMAATIVEHRKRHGAFRSVEDLAAVKGIGPSKLDSIRPMVVVHGATARIVNVAPKSADIDERTPIDPAPSTGGKVNINTASAKALTALPGVGPKTAEAIVSYREKNGKFSSVSDLKNVKGLGEKTIDKFRDQAAVN